MKTETIKIPKKIVEFCNELLQRKDKDLTTEENPFTFTADFGNGLEADIKVVNADPPYVDPVLFLNGNEVGLLPPDAETLEGEYIFQLGLHDHYRVVVETYGC